MTPYAACPSCRLRIPRIARPGGLCHECVPGAVVVPTAVASVPVAQVETITVTSSYGVEVTLTPGVIDNDASHYFSAGQCHALAAAISAETGWDMVLVRRRCGTCDTCEGYACGAHEEGDGSGRDQDIDYECEDCVDSADCGTTYIEHCAVATPDGRYLDIDAVRDRDAMGQAWGEGDTPEWWLEENDHDDSIADLEHIPADQVESLLADLVAEEEFDAPRLDIAAHFVTAALALAEPTSD